MGQSYTSLNPSPQPSGDQITFHWRDDIREYDTNNYRADNVKFGFSEEDLELVFGNLRYLSYYESRCTASYLLSIVIMVLINIAPIWAYVYMSIQTDGRYLWTLSLIPVYLAICAVLPFLFNWLQEVLWLRGLRKRRAAQFQQTLEKLNDRNFRKRGFRAVYNEGDCVITVSKI